MEQALLFITGALAGTGAFLTHIVDQVSSVAHDLIRTAGAAVTAGSSARSS